MKTTLYLSILLVSFFIGLLLMKTPTNSRRNSARELLITRNGEKIIQLAVGEGPGLWLMNKNALFTAAIHGDNTPMLLVSDRAIRNFGLGRMDGRFSSAILVYRTDDIVRSVFGLDMTDVKQEPFLVHWQENKKNLFLGKYCDHPERACTG